MLYNPGLLLGGDWWSGNSDSFSYSDYSLVRAMVFVSSSILSFFWVLTRFFTVSGQSHSGFPTMGLPNRKKDSMYFR